LSLGLWRKTAQALAQWAHRFARGRKRRTRTSASGWALSRNAVGKWRRRFIEHWMPGFYDEPRPGAPRQIGDDEVVQVVRQSLEATPRDATHGVCAQWRKRPGRAFDPAHVEGFQPPASPHRGSNSQPILCFVEKVRDIVGLYLSLPQHAVVLCVDEKSQIQALDRPQPLLPRPAPAFLSTGRRGERSVRRMRKNLTRISVLEGL
jgi:hypothetical protein